MRPFVSASLVSLVAVALVASPAFAQDAGASPDAAGSPVGTEPLPYVEYLAALEAFTQQDPFAMFSDPPTQEEVVAGFRNLAAMATDVQVRLQGVVPEDCYAEAHEELLAYWQSSIELTEDAADQLEAATTVEEVGPIASALDEILFERHPVAYVELEDGSGFQGSVFNILHALATCEAGMPDDVSAAESVAPGSPAP